MTESIRTGEARVPVTEVRTFLIVDIRGYTRFTEEYGDEAAARLTSRFAELVREVVEAREGSVLELRGDEALAVFASPRATLRAAVELQARFGEEEASDPGLPLRAGIGIDAGEAIPVEAGFRGTALNLAARLCSLAGPGETLASETVINLARKIDGLAYAARGAVQLKGFADLVRVVQVERAVGAQPSAVRDQPSVVTSQISVVSDDLPRGSEAGPSDLSVERVVRDSLMRLHPFPPSPLEGEGGRGERGPSQQLPIGGFLGSLPERPLVARGEELSRMLAALDAVKGGEGRLLLLSGEPGAGKTRLAQELTLRARNRGFLIAAGSCFEQRQTVPYYPWVDALAALYAVAPSSVRSAVPRRWPLLEHLLPEAPFSLPEPSTVGDQPSDLGPEAPPAPQARLGSEGRGRDRDGGQGGEEQERLFRAVAGFVQTMVRENPVAILLDDLQWADEASLGLLEHLARHTRAHRLLLLGILREGEAGGRGPLDRTILDLHRGGLSERIVVRRMDREETAQLLATSLGEADVLPEFVDLIYRHTEGNPFFTEEVLRALVERGDVVHQDGVWDQRAAEQIEVPESVRTVIGQRLARLSQGAQELLREASVLGQSFDFDVLQTLTGRKEEEVEAGLNEAVAAGLLREGRPDRYSFNHGLTQAALYADLAPRRKRRLHLAAAGALEDRLTAPRSDGAGSGRRAAGRQWTAELAWHFLQGGDQERASTYAMQAGDEAEAVFAHAEAERQYRVVVEMARETGHPLREAEARYKLGVVLKGVGRYDEALALLEEAARLFQELANLEGERLAVAQIARVHRYRATLDEGITRVERFLETSAGQERSRGLADVYAAVSLLYSWRGQTEQHLETAERAAAIARAVGDERLLAEAEIRRCEVLALRGQVQERRRVLEEMLPLAERTGDPEILHAYLVNLGIDERSAGRLERARELHTRSLEVVERAGNVGRAGFSMCQLGDDLFYIGRWGEAAGWYQRAGQALQPLGSSSYAAYPAIGLGRLRLVQGMREEGSRVLEEGLTVAQQTGDAQAVQKARLRLVERDLRLGQPESALRRLGQPAEERQAGGEEALFLAEALVRLGRQEEAVEVATGGIERAQAAGQQLDLADLRRVRGLALAGCGRPDEAAEDFREAAEASASVRYPYAEGRALAEWGHLLLTRCEADRAGLHLERALSIFRRLGAWEDAVKLQAELQELGQS